LEDASWDEENILLSYYKTQAFINKRNIQYLSLIAIIKAAKGAEAGDLNKVIDNVREVMFPWEKSALLDKAKEIVKRLDKFKSKPFLIRKVGK
jgi:hypothetical protein